MKDLISLLNDASLSFSKIEGDYDDNLQRIKKMKSFEDLVEINKDDQSAKDNLARLNLKSKMHKLELERIIGKNNLMDISFFSKGMEVAKTVCRIIHCEGESIQAMATGFLIGERLLMTNNHVIEDISDANSLMAEFEYEKDVMGRIKETFIFKMAPQEFFITNSALDYTVVALEPIAQNNKQKELKNYGWNDLSSSKNKVILGQAVSIIQHPQGLPKKIAIRENKIIKIFENRINYETDTQKGSSGSLVANDKWEIIALHKSGVPKINAKKEILLSKGGVWRNENDTDFIIWKANQGILMSKILADIYTQKLPKKQEEIKKRILNKITFEFDDTEYKLPI